MITQQFASPEEALAHFGVKGMKWGVRKQDFPSGPRPPRSQAEKKARAKKVAIGFGALVVVAGAAAVTYQLNKNGKLPVSSIKKTAQATTAVKKVLSEPTSIIHASRGKNVGNQFFQKGGTPDFFEHWSKAFEQVGGGATQGIFKHLPDGTIATSFADPLGRKDRAGRLILHDVLIPKVMASNVKNKDDVLKHIWPIVARFYKYD